MIPAAEILQGVAALGALVSGEILRRVRRLERRSSHAVTTAEEALTEARAARHLVRAHIRRSKGDTE